MNDEPYAKPASRTFLSNDILKSDMPDAMDHELMHNVANIIRQMMVKDNDSRRLAKKPYLNKIAMDQLVNRIDDINLELDFADASTWIPGLEAFAINRNYNVYSNLKKILEDYFRWQLENEKYPNRF